MEGESEFAGKEIEELAERSAEEEREWKTEDRRRGEKERDGEGMNSKKDKKIMRAHKVRRLYAYNF